MPDIQQYSVSIKYKTEGADKATSDTDKVKKSVKQGSDTVVGNRPGRNKDYVAKYTGYPKTIIKFNNENKQIHPTQKPVELMEYLIKTYTNEGEVVLDFTMGSGSTGVACVNTNRKFIGIELDGKYFEIAKNRIEGIRGDFK